jgi:hypothetical protein
VNSGHFLDGTIVTMVGAAAQAKISTLTQVSKHDYIHSFQAFVTDFGICGGHI